MSIVGQSVQRVDALGKVTGQALYPGDIDMPGQTYEDFVCKPPACGY